MSDVQQDLEGFYQFASRQIVLGHGQTLSDLFDEWHSQQQTPQELYENARAVKAALRDIEAGETGKPFEVFAHEFRQRNNLANDA
jgi:hypothetical protein